jgi:hypothetical protein
MQVKKATQAIEDARDTSRGWFGSAKEKSSDAVHGAKVKAGEARDKGGDIARDVKEKVG